MTSNGYERLAAIAPRTATGALDHVAIEARARQLRREAVGSLVGALVQRIVCAWARAANWLAAKPLPDGCARC